MPYLFNTSQLEDSISRMFRNQDGNIYHAKCRGLSSCTWTSTVIYDTFFVLYNTSISIEMRVPL